MAPNRQSIASVIRSLSFEDLFVADAKYPALTSASASAAAKAAAAAPSCSSQPQPQRGGGSDDDDRSEKSRRRRQRQRQRRAPDARAEDEDEDEEVEVVRAHRLAIRDAEAFFAWPAPSLTPDEEAENGDAERLRGKDDEEREAREREEAVEQVRRMLMGRAMTARRAVGASYSEGNLRGDAVPETRRRRSGGAPESGGDYWRWDSPDDDVGPGNERRDDGGAQHAGCIPPNPQEKEGEDESEELLLLQYAEGQGCPVGTDHGYHGCYYGEAVVGAWEEGMDGMGGGGYGDGYWDV